MVCNMPSKRARSTLLVTVEVHHPKVTAYFCTPPLQELPHFTSRHMILIHRGSNFLGIQHISAHPHICHVSSLNLFIRESSLSLFFFFWGERAVSYLAIIVRSLCTHKETIVSHFHHLLFIICTTI
jgi:hypothetical protein